MIKLFRIMVVCIATIMVSCTTDEGQPESNVVDTPQIKNSSILKGTAKQLEVINTDKSIVWSSDDSAIVTVDNEGLATGMAPGTARVTAKTEDSIIQEWIVTVASQPLAGSEFIATWEGTEITIPTNSNLTYSYNIDWDNDGVVDQAGVTGDVTHTFGTSGKHTIRISGVFPAIYFGRSTHENKEKFISLDQWGTNEWLSMRYAFDFCKNLKIPATDVPNLSKVTDMEGMFYAAWEANPDVSNWDVSNVTNMALMFLAAKLANPDVSNWDVSNVTTMERMFKFAKSASPDVSNWNVSNVTNMGGMFAYIESWNPDVSDWDVSNVTDMSSMFDGVKVVNPLANPDVSNWDVSKVTNMDSMFRGAAVANPDVGNWNVSSVTDMSYMFVNAVSANPNVSSWDVSNVTNMSNMFEETIIANPDVSNWNVSNVANMGHMFKGAKAANPNVGSWDVSGVTNMGYMFEGTQAAQPNVRDWNVSNVKHMDFMFAGSNAANPDVKKWNIGSVLTMDGLVVGASSLSKTKYENLLINFAGQPHPMYTFFEVRNDLIATSAEAVAARQSLIDNSLWVIIDGSTSLP